MSVATYYNIPVLTYITEKKYELNISDAMKSYIAGIFTGLTLADSCPLRDRAKKNYELGRTAAFHLRVKAEFELNKRLGINALQKDSYYYGNSSEAIQNRAVKLDIKVRFTTLFKVENEGNECYHVLNQLASFIALEHLSEAEYDRQIENNIVSFESILDKFTRPVIADKRRQKGKQKEKRPALPRRSPCYLNSEMTIISDCMSKVWKPLEQLRTNYVKEIREGSFDAFCINVNLIMNRRWNLMLRFASSTTKRLQEYRKTGPVNDNLRKATMTQEMITALLRRRNHPAKDFADEIVKIIGKDDLQVAASSISNTIPTSYEMAYGVVYNAAIAIYSKDGVYSENKEESSKQILDEMFLTETKIAEVANLADNLGNKIANIDALVKMNDFNKPVRWLARLTNLTGVISNVEKAVALLQNVNEEWIPMVNAIRLYSEKATIPELIRSSGVAVHKAREFIATAMKRPELREVLSSLRLDRNSL